MSADRFPVLVRELKALKRSHDALTDRLSDFEERLDEAIAAATPPPTDPPEVPRVTKKKEGIFD